MASSPDFSEKITKGLHEESFRERPRKQTYLGIVQEVRTGGQSGVDQACMRHADLHGVRVGGWIPAERMAEISTAEGYLDSVGGIPQELLEKGDYRETIEANVLPYLRSFDEAQYDFLELTTKLKRNPSDPSIRTELQVLDSDATFIITTDSPLLQDGTVIMEGLSRRYGKPCFVLTYYLDQGFQQDEITAARQWVYEEQPRILNLGGPRASHGDEVGISIEAIAEEGLDAVFS
jgi:hypothetical protein